MEIFNNQSIMETQILYDALKMQIVFKKNGKLLGGLIGNAAEDYFLKSLDSNNNIKLINMSDKSAKIRRLRAIWFKLGIDDQREAILESYGVKSTALLSVLELDELIQKYSSFNSKNDAPKDIRKLRSSALQLLTKIGVYDNDGNWERVNQYLMNPRIAGKLLYEMNILETEALIKKLRSIESKQKSNGLGNVPINLN